MPVEKAQQVPVNICGSSVFGLNSKISLEKTYNMFISDNWLVNYAGYQLIKIIAEGEEGRGLFHSIRGDFLIAVIGTAVYRINPGFGIQLIGNIETTTGEVYMDENLAGMICIVDGTAAYIYPYAYTIAALDQNILYRQVLLDQLNDPPFVMIPGYVSYHNTFFLIASAPISPYPQVWCAFGVNPTPTAPNFVDLIVVADDVTSQSFLLQTKPDSALAVVRIPGKGNNVMVLGSTVGEIWTQTGGELLYQRAQSVNINNGVISVSTIASSDEFVCWLGQNENNSPVILFSSGGPAQIISTDGIDNVLQNLKFPAESTAFFFRQDGHLFYQITFYNDADNLSLIYDFTTQKFFHVTDEALNFYPARQVVFFNNETYFLSLNDAGLYAMGTNYTTYNYNTDPNIAGEEIPRIRVCKAIRKEDSSTFRAGMFTFWLEQGVTNDIPFSDDIPLPNLPRVDMSMSKNGGQSFSNIVGRTLNTPGHYQNQIRWWRLGRANELIIQLRFNYFQRVVAYEGTVEIY